MLLLYFLFEKYKNFYKSLFSIHFCTKVSSFERCENLIPAFLSISSSSAREYVFSDASSTTSACVTSSFGVSMIVGAVSGVSTGLCDFSSSVRYSSGISYPDTQGKQSLRYSKACRGFFFRNFTNCVCFQTSAIK